MTASRTFNPRALSTVTLFTHRCTASRPLKVGIFGATPHPQKHSINKDVILDVEFNVDCDFVIKIVKLNNTAKIWGLNEKCVRTFFLGNFQTSLFE